MKLKRYLCAAVCLLAAALTLGGCKKAQDGDALPRFLIGESVRLTGEMDEMAESEAYLRMMSGSQEIWDTVEEIGAQDYAAPQKAYLVQISDDAVLQLLGGEDIGQLEDSIRQKLNRKLFAGALSSYWNGRSGVTGVAATALLAWQESYIQPDGWQGNVAVWLEYPGDYSSMVSFVQSGEGVVSASASFVVNGDGQDLENMLATMQEMLEELGLSDALTYETVPAEQIQQLLAE